MKQIADLDLDGYAIGGLAVGEPTDVMYEMISEVEPYMPKDKIRYLMGVGTPATSSRLSPGAWTSLTASCPAATPVTAT